jgi:hypothetical protein
MKEIKTPQDHSANKLLNKRDQLDLDDLLTKLMVIYTMGRYLVDKANRDNYVSLQLNMTWLPWKSKDNPTPWN